MFLWCKLLINIRKIPLSHLLLRILFNIQEQQIYLYQKIIIFLLMLVEQTPIQPSMLDPSRFNLRNKGLRTAAGKLHKGCVKDAFTKLSIGSIPSNYQSIIYHHEEKKGFGTSQKRFYNGESVSEFMGSEIQEKDRCQSQQKQNNASYSIKGYGPLIARQQREWYKYDRSPGPGRYFDDKQNTRMSKKRRHCYDKQKDDMKRKQILMNKENLNIPGPGHYQVAHSVENQGAGCKSSFVTKDRREAYIPKNSTPGPGQYVTGEVESMPESKRRDEQQEELYTRMKQVKQPKPKYYLPKRPAPTIPGPGYYDCEVPSFKPLYQRIKISNYFVQSGKNRFNDPQGVIDANVPVPVGPTPYSYNVPSDFDKIEKKLIDMSCFMSQSRREPFQAGGLGPNVQFSGVTANRKNFHFNICGQWL